MIEFISSLHSHIMDVERIPYLVVALLICTVAGVITGPFQGRAYPFLWIVLDALFGRFGDRLNRKGRARADLILRGFVFTVFILVLAFGLAMLSISQFGAYSYFEIFLVCCCLSSGAAWYVVLKVYFALSKDVDVDAAHLVLARSSDVDLNSVDRHGVCRVAIGVLATSFDKGGVLPCFWYLIGGLPLMLMATALSFLAWRYDSHSGFGQFILSIEKLLGFVPSVFAGLLLVLSIMLSKGAAMLKVVSSWWNLRNNTPYERSGFVLSAYAVALKVALGGSVTRLKGRSEKFSWVGVQGASAKVEPEHLKRAILASVIAHVLFLLCLLSAYLYGAYIFV